MNAATNKPAPVICIVGARPNYMKVAPIIRAQEVPYADSIRSYSKPGESQIIFQIKDSSRAHEVPNVWYQVRKKVGDMRFTLPAGIQGPFFNDEFGDVYGVIYALESDGFSNAEVRCSPMMCASSCCVSRSGSTVTKST